MTIEKKNNTLSEIQKMAETQGTLDLLAAYVMRHAKVSEETAEDIALKLHMHVDVAIDELLEAETSDADAAPAPKNSDDNKTLLSMDTHGYVVEGLSGTWRTVDHTEVDGHIFWLMVPDVDEHEASGIIVNDVGEVCLTRVLWKAGFDSHTVKVLHEELLPVETMPDPSISVQEMKKYGYFWGGMLPLDLDKALELRHEFQVYRLYEDDSESATDEKHAIRDHHLRGGIFGIQKTEWLAYLEKRDVIEALIQKMNAEQEEFEKTLFAMPSVRKAFDGYAWEYTLRNDILMSLKEGVDWDEWSTDECRALLDSPQPLSDILEDIRRRDDGGDHMDSVSAAIYDRARKLLKKETT